MGNYEQLKQSVSDVIKTNGNQEITGSILQNVLLTIISTVGANATFAGIATPATNPGTPDGPVFYLASKSGTYSNFGSIELQDGLSVLMWNGSWSSQQVFCVDDEPTAESDNLVKSGGVQEELALGAVYDVSAKNPTGGSNNDGKWESLSALLEDANLDTLIPTSVRKGGMSIKFVQSSDNKYVQYMYNGTSTAVADFTNVAHWEKTNLEDEVRQLGQEVGKLTDIVIGPNAALLQGYYLLTTGIYSGDDAYRNKYVCLAKTIGPFRLEVNDGFCIDSICVFNTDETFKASLLVTQNSLITKVFEARDTSYLYRVNIRKIDNSDISISEDIIKNFEEVSNKGNIEQQTTILREEMQVQNGGFSSGSGVSLISPVGVAKAKKIVIDYPIKYSATDCYTAFLDKNNNVISLIKPFAVRVPSTISSISSIRLAIDVPKEAYFVVCTKADNVPIRIWIDGEEDETFRFADLTRGYYQKGDGIRYTDDEYSPLYVSNPQLVTPPFYLRARDGYIIDSVTKYENGAFNSFGSVSLESTRISTNDGYTYGINIKRKDGGRIATSVLPWDIIESFGDVEGQEIDAVTFIPSDNDGTIALGLNYKMKDYTENGTRYLSMTDDNGVTWNTVENTYGDIVFVHFFLNGNVLFATSKKCYYSSDNLVTIQESTVYDLDGSAFVADEADYFYQQRNYSNENCVVDGTERLLWGDYYIGSVSSWEARIWETHDNGQTVNCIFKYGTSQIDGQVISARHSHAVFFNKYNQKWYGLSGDDGNNCNVIEISYNGSYNFSLIGMGDNYKFANAFFDADNAYFITDYTISGTIRGILRCPIDQLRDFNNYKYIWKVEGNVPLTGYVTDAVGHKFITPDGIGYNKLFFAESGLRFKRLFANFPNTKQSAPDWIFGPDYNGEYYVFCWQGGYSTATYKFVLSGNLYNLSKAMGREGIILNGGRI